MKNPKHTHYINIYKLIVFIMCNYYMYAYSFIYMHIYILHTHKYVYAWPTIYTAGHSAFWRLKIEGEDSFVYLLYFYRKIWGISLHHTYSLNTKVKYDFCHYHNYCNSFNSF